MSTQIFDRGWAPGPWPQDVLGVVHDLRAPLSIISGYGAMLAAGDLGDLPDAAREAVEAMTAKASEMRTLLDGLLEVGRPERHEDAARQVHSLDLRDVAAAAVERAAPRARLGGDAVHVAAAGPVPVRANPVLLARIMDNLLNNAFTYAPHPSRITLTVRRRGGFGQVRVEDDGEGIAEVVREHVFGGRPRPLPAAEGGGGLGLFVCRSLAERCGGDLRCDDEGSGFTLELPLAR